MRISVDRERRLVISELLEVFTVSMVVVSLRFGFCFGFRRFFCVPVHVRKRRGRLRPATTARFFSIASGCAVKILRS
jgi:hypothetical protein